MAKTPTRQRSDAPPANPLPNAEAIRLAVLQRMLRNAPRNDALVSRIDNPMSVQIKYNEEDPYTVAPPYGFLPYGMQASRDELIAAVKFFGRKKLEYVQSGDYYRSWLFGQRQRMFQGILDHSVKFRLV